MRGALALAAMAAFASVSFVFERLDAVPFRLRQLLRLFSVPHMRPRL